MLVSRFRFGLEKGSMIAMLHKKNFLDSRNQSLRGAGNGKKKPVSGERSFAERYSKPSVNPSSHADAHERWERQKENREE